MSNIDKNTAHTKVEGKQNSSNFQWIDFYQEIANKLLAFENRRQELIKGIYTILEKLELDNFLQDKFEDGSSGSLQDICPFTVMGIFNRGVKGINRTRIAQELAKLLGVSMPAPQTFDGIPILNNQNSWFFDYGYKQQKEDIDNLWKMFRQAITYADKNNDNNKIKFKEIYNNVIKQNHVKWNLTMGLYWIRPKHYLPLDRNSRKYIEIHLNDRRFSDYKVCSADEYFKLMDILKEEFKDENFPVHSFPELSYEAWLSSNDNSKPTKPNPTPSNKLKEETKTTMPYSIENILAEGCFLPKEQLEKILQRLQIKKNLILQGPPGTGKTWLAKRLAFALVGEKDAKTSKIRAVQFHPNLSYEDFVRGWRPSGDGKLALVDGIFMEMIQTAKKNLNLEYVVVIEEINRGNPAQIFGEMLTLLEADKRIEDEALTLSYQRKDGKRIFIPKNLYIIGTMNIADRSLALVDLALRRRFAFINLMPLFNEAWEKWLKDCGIAESAIETIKTCLTALNKQISEDPNLGTQFQIGHSYFTPSEKEKEKKIADVYEWFEQIIESEISPLLDEYWFDNPDKAKAAKDLLKISV
ncbi:McrB family protein [Avibacterium sp. 21-594]|uniref:McrB family protein n=1 Tax=Avibacterium sp. 21-594 TaxID=2911535 RepID=UPI0022453CCB|nr:AAA family ATPase [Avibacterium sp. 21-594]MCW9716251.1 AAA family ATPase [Avibacterium sp. 21-594]